MARKWSSPWCATCTTARWSRERSPSGSGMTATSTRSTPARVAARLRATLDQFISRARRVRVLPDLLPGRTPQPDAAAGDGAQRRAAPAVVRRSWPPGSVLDQALPRVAGRFPVSLAGIGDTGNSFALPRPRGSLPVIMTDYAQGKGRDGPPGPGQRRGPGGDDPFDGWLTPGSIPPSRTSPGCMTTGSAVTITSSPTGNWARRWRPWTRGYRLRARRTGRSWAGRSGSWPGRASGSSSTSARASLRQATCTRSPSQPHPVPGWSTSTGTPWRSPWAVSCSPAMTAPPSSRPISVTWTRSWSDPAVGRLIDFGEPVAIMLVAILHFVLDADDPYGLVAPAPGHRGTRQLSRPVPCHQPGQ